MGIEILSEIWPDWDVEAQIGEGAFGKVYKIVRNDTDFSTCAALKVITVPKSESEVESLQAEGMSVVGAKSYLQGIVSDFINEIRLMESMKGTSNIVSVEDYKVIEKKDGIGWDIFIRMELLTPLVKKLTQTCFDEKDVIKLGIDICSALELCAKRNIVHRDIKPENIFVSDFGDYKIGDFGIAKQLEKTSSALSSKGTFNYIAPEVARGQKYDARVDIYSLGIVLYKLLNNNRLPFIDPYKELISYEEKRLGVERRLSGEALPPPVNASKAMATVIGMACRYNPEERFATPTAMKNALTRVLNQPAVKSPEVLVEPPIQKRPVNTYRPPAGVQQAPKRVNSPSAPVYPPKPPANNGVPKNYQQVNRPSVPLQRTGSVSMSQSNRFNPMLSAQDNKSKSGSGKGLIMAIILVAVIAIAVIVFACTALAGYEEESAGRIETTATVLFNDTVEIVDVNTDVDDQYDSQV